MYRLFSFGVVALWIGAMAALFARDVWPAWTAQEPPPMTRDQLEEGQTQFGLYQNGEQRIGTAWNALSHNGQNTKITGNVLVDGLSFITPVRIQSLTEFDVDGTLDRFRLDVYGVPLTTIRIDGERRGIFFPCNLQIGPLHRQTNLDLADSRMIGESLRPFVVLPTLRVGQSWRMQMLDPLSAVMRRKADFTRVVARVTRTEVIEHLGQSVKCFVVETSPYQATAWVDAQGAVLVQEVRMPGLGRITIRQETFNQTDLNRAIQQVPAQPLPTNSRTINPE